MVESLPLFLLLLKLKRIFVALHLALSTSQKLLNSIKNYGSSEVFGDG
jgi:hypothetical protein